MTGATATSVPPPVLGWNTREPLMEMKPGCAILLDNWVPREGDLAVRPGWRKWATGMPGRIGGLFAWRSGAAQRLYAASGTGIYDVTASGAVGAPVVTGFGATGAQGMMVAAGGSNFLLVYNGTNAEKVYDGTNWTNWAATGTPTPTSWACQYQTRIFCGRSDVLAFWYGPPAAIGGAFVQFPLQGICTRGGGVVGGIAWTLDSGAGLNDNLVVFTSEGEAVAYHGTDPSNVNAWSLVGRWTLPRPLGLRFVQPFGGDVLILTESGIYPFSAVATSGVDAAVLPSKAYTLAIEPTFLAFAQDRRTQDGWQIAPLERRGLWLLNVPWGNNDAQQVVFRAATGACGRWLGIPASVWLETTLGDYAGHAGEGSVLRWGEDTTDNGNAILAEMAQAYSSFGKPVTLKAFKLVMPVMADASAAALTVDMLLDWQLPPSAGIARGPGAPPLTGGAPATDWLVWDQGKWDVNRWLSAGLARREWRAVRGIGQAGAVHVQVLAATASPTWYGCNVVYEAGGALR